MTADPGDMPLPPWLGGGDGSPWTRGSSARGDSLRVSEAERRQVSELLGRHFADGRLDEGEFEERMQAAVTAKTRRELASVLSDLPPPAGPPAPARRRHRLVVALVLALLVVWSFGWLFWPPHLPLVLVGVVAWWVLRRHRHDAAVQR